MEFDRHQHREEEEEEMGVPVPPMVGNSSEGGGGVSLPVGARKGNSPSVRYKECLKNHAIGIGSHAVDGCREFLAAGEEGKLEALICAACNCHRNFHRKETTGETPMSFPPHHYHPHHVPPYYRTPSPSPGGYHRRAHLSPYPLASHPLSHPLPLALPTATTSGGGYSRDEEDMSKPSSSGGGGSGSGSKNKRFRTKFTPDQKDKMLSFAERLGWKMQKHDDATVEQFCADIGVKKQVLKVWMHNNRNSLSKKP